MNGVFPSPVISAAIASCEKYGIPASVTLAQWAVESAWGAHMSGKNNPFGIKAKPPAPCTSCMTREVIHGEVIHETQFFADYPDMSGAFDAHAKLLATYGAYANARRKLPDAEAFAHALTGVYATDPHYGDTLVSVMRTHGLSEYDVPHPPTSPPIVRSAPAVHSPGALHVAAPSKPSALERFLGWLGIASALALIASPALAGSQYTVDPSVQSPNAALWAWVAANILPLVDQFVIAVAGAALSWAALKAAPYFHVKITAQQEDSLRQAMLTGVHAALASGESAADRAQLVERGVAWAKRREAVAIGRLGLPEQVLAAMAEKMVAQAVGATFAPQAS